MNDELKKVFSQKETFLRLEKHLLKKAGVLYTLCLLSDHKTSVFKNITPSQMAALGDCIQTAVSLKEAKEKVNHFLDSQLEKLEEKVSSSKAPPSWLTPVGKGKDKGPLGSILRGWIIEEKYLEMEDIKLSDDLRLSALQRFWGNLYGFYRYEYVFEEPMVLKDFDSIDPKPITRQEVNQP